MLSQSDFEFALLILDVKKNEYSIHNGYVFFYPISKEYQSTKYFMVIPEKMISKS